VQLRPISIGKDYGTTLEVLAGVSTQDQVVINPADSLEEGQQVNLAPPSPGQGQDQSAAQPPAVPRRTRQEESLPEQQRTPQDQSGQQRKPKAKGSKL
jgi:hypothetical protein